MTLKNLIVNSSSTILAGVVIPNTNVKITHLGVGIGNNNGKIPSEDVNKTELIHEVRRTKISRSGYIKRDMIRYRSLAWTIKCHTVLKLLFTKSRK